MQKPKGDEYVHYLRNHKNFNTTKRKCCVHGKEEEKTMDETEIDESGEMASLGQNGEVNVYSASAGCH